jgi:hypothetical protein
MRSSFKFLRITEVILKQSKLFLVKCFNSLKNLKGFSIEIAVFTRNILRASVLMEV